MKTRKNSLRGQTLVEYALMLPLMLLLILFMIDAGRGIYYYSVIHNAAREGARYGVIHPTDLSGIQDAANQLAVGLDSASLIITPLVPGDGTVQVTVVYSFAPVTPIVNNFFSGGVLTLQTKSTMNIEG